MPTRRVPQDEMFILVPNRTSHKIVVATVQIDPGKVGKIPVRQLVGNFDRCVALASLMDKGSVAAQFDYAKGGMAAIPVNSAYILALQAPSAGVVGRVP